MTENPRSVTRHARFAGSWYPRDPQALGQMISAAWDQAARDLAKSPFTTPRTNIKSPFASPGNAVPIPGEAFPRGLLLPHPGLAFGLETQVRGVMKACSNWSPECIIILSPSHYSALPPDTLVSAPYGLLETPLARLVHRLDHPLAPGLSLNQEILDTEHGLESLLPLMSWLWPDAEYTLLVCSGAVSGQGLGRMARTVRKLAEKGEERRTLLVASSDMSHCGWRFDDPLKRSSGMDMAGFSAQVLERDRKALEMAGKDPLGLLQDRDRLAPTMCGLVPVLVLQTLLGASPVLIAQSSSLQARQSEGEDSGDDTFVTYAAAGWENSTWRT